VVAAWLGYLAIRSVIDLASPARVSGLVIARSPLRGRRTGRTPIDAVVIDSGRADTALAWLAAPELAATCEPDQMVHLHAERWTRHLRGHVAS
jgi:allantoicase